MFNQVVKGRIQELSRSLRPEKPVKTHKTAYMRASKSSEHELDYTSLRVHWTTLESVVQVQEGAPKEQHAAQALLQKQPELKLLPSSLRAFCRDNDINPLQVISVKKSGTVATRPYGDSGDVLLRTIRATADMRGKEWFDCVRVKGMEEDGELVDWYAEVRLFFVLRLAHGGHRTCAFVRWFTVVTPPEDDVLSMYDCVCLKYECEQAKRGRARGRAAGKTKAKPGKTKAGKGKAGKTKAGKAKAVNACPSRAKAGKAAKAKAAKAKAAKAKAAKGKAAKGKAGKPAKAKAAKPGGGGGSSGAGGVHSGEQKRARTDTRTAVSSESDPPEETPVYGVLEIESIKCCEYIVKDFRNPGHFHVSAFKWDRATVGFKEELVDAYGKPLP